jgi:hypothetical protein
LPGTSPCENNLPYKGKGASDSERSDSTVTFCEPLTLSSDRPRDGQDPKLTASAVHRGLSSTIAAYKACQLSDTAVKNWFSVSGRYSRKVVGESQLKVRFIRQEATKGVGVWIY